MLRSAEEKADIPDRTGGAAAEKGQKRIGAGFIMVAVAAGITVLLLIAGCWIGRKSRVEN